MEQIEIIQAKIEIAELEARYGYYCDRPGWEEILAMFTEDAVFDAGAVYGSTWEGTEQLRQFYENSPGRGRAPSDEPVHRCPR